MIESFRVFCAATATMVLSSGLVLAQSRLTSTEAARALGAMLASETPCGFSYNHDAVIAWAATNAPADDPQFLEQLGFMTQGFGQTLRSLNETDLAASCADVEQVARRSGFIE